MVRGQPVQLSGTQYRLASLFFSNIGRVMSRDHIFAMVWGREFREFTRTIDSHVSRLRLLLEIEPQNEFRLQPVYKSGYRLLHLRQVLEIDGHLGRTPPEGCKSLGRLHPHEGLDRFPKEVRFVHAGVRNCKRFLVESVFPW